MAEARLGVEIDNARIVDVAPLRPGARGSVDLAAIEQGQRRALVKLYVVQGTRHTELTLIKVSNLPVFPKRRALLHLRVEVDHAGTLRVRLDVENRLYSKERIDVRRYLRRRRPAVLAVVLALLILGGAGYYFLLGSPSEEGSVAEQRETEPTAGAQAPEDEGAAETEPPPEPDSAAAAEPEAEPTEPQPEGEPDSEPEPTAEPQEQAQAEPEPEPQPEPTEPALEPAEWIVYFRPDSPELTAETRQALDEAAEELERYGPDAEVSIVGHTALAGTEQGRYGLSRERARNVFSYLESTAWNAEQDVSVEGVGGEQPVTRDEDRQELNRRVEIRVQPEETAESAE